MGDRRGPLTHRPEDLVVFLGPSLSHAEAVALAPCLPLPPAGQGDVWRALALRPRAICLIDGLFESRPSVWHRELLAALEAGVQVFGAASMGALRAAELWSFGMIGVGRIFGWIQAGIVEDDSEVALLHAGGEHGYRPMTVPQVNVRWAAELARVERILDAGEARALVRAGAGIFYQDRIWPRVVARAARGWRRGTRARFERWAARGPPDLKAEDARQGLLAAAEFVARRAPAAPQVARPRPSSLVRRHRLTDGSSASGGRLVPGEVVLERLRRRGDRASLTEVGVRRALLAGWARSQGLVPDAAALRRAEASWLPAGVVARSVFLAASGLDVAEARRLTEDLALERLALSNANRLLADGSSELEALAAEARRTGIWAREAAGLARR